jgi:hypothetical protein
MRREKEKIGNCSRFRRGQGDNDRRMVTSIDYSRIRFLESAANVKRVLKGAMGREPSTRLSLDVAVCLQQGRLFYEAAEVSAPEIRPLLIFYGMLNFAKALAIGRTGTMLEQLDRGHGLKDRSSNSDVLENLTVEVTGQGTFQQFNDTIRESDSVRFESLGEYVRRYIPSSPSASLQNKKVNLKAILGRIPGSLTMMTHLGLPSCAWIWRTRSITKLNVRS